MSQIGTIIGAIVTVVGVGIAWAKINRAYRRHTTVDRGRYYSGIDAVRHGPQNPDNPRLLSTYLDVLDDEHQSD